MNKVSDKFIIREAKPSEYLNLGDLTVDVYAKLPDMPGPDKMPAYYELLKDVKGRAESPTVKIYVAVDQDQKILGGVTFIGDMQYYASGGSATSVKNSSGFRLLAVGPRARGLGVGKALTQYCVERARELGGQQVVMHTTKSMQVAWGMYERMGFQRMPEIDFKQGELQVFGFSLPLI